MYATSLVDENQDFNNNFAINSSDNSWAKSYSYNFYDKKNKTNNEIFYLSQNYINEKLQKKENNKIFKDYDWDFSKGDYQVKRLNSKDFAYYQKKKNRILKYSIYPALIISLLLTFIILNFLVEFPL